MKWIITFSVLSVASILLFPFSRNQHRDSSVKEFRVSPIVNEGRIQPMDSLARTVLLQLHGSQSYTGTKGNKQPAVSFLYTLSTNREQAETLKLFRIDHPQIRSQLDKDQPKRKYFSLEEIKATKSVFQEQLRDIIELGESNNTYFSSLYKLSHQMALFDSTYELLKKDHKEINSSSAKLLCEVLLNSYAPFIKCIELYTVALLFILLFWLCSKTEFWTGAIILAVSGLFLHTVALLIRAYIQGTPPVTNIYSSAIFIAWSGVFIGLLLEKKSHTGYGVATAGILGICSLIVAHNLTSTGDNLSVLQAAINSNFWLSTHVITITLGYSSAFVSGILGIFIVLSKKSQDTTSDISRMLFGTICLTLFCCFLGTLLGGIWADQAWGRFWGWDPKENGALIIILWYALMLHAKHGKLVSTLGFARLAIFGNCITAWSWFGTNLLGVGLHSYGFTGNGALWLCFFCIINLMITAYSFLGEKKNQPPARTGL